MVEKFKAKFRALIEDYKVTKNPGEDFVFWYIHRVAPFNFRYVVAVGIILCIAALYTIIFNTRSQQCSFYGSLPL